MPSILTNIGIAAFAAAAAPDGSPVPFSKMVFGDGNGNPITLDPDATSLTNEVYEAGLQAVVVDPNNSDRLICTAFIPAAAGPFTLREVGLESATGDLLAIGSTPTVEKAVAENSMSYTFVVEVTNAVDAVIQLSSPVAVTSARVINTQNGTKGGGDLSTDRTIELDIDGLPVIAGANVVGADDTFGLYDKSADLNKKITTDELVIALGVQDKIDASVSEAIGGLPEDQVLGLSTEAETITGTNTTKATHAAGVKAAIDEAISNVSGDLFFLGGA
ncbi:phage tail protein [Maritalea porphyrae]|uniref:phage tail-collar fiber domain-containing protein n=1 Tax=Maritalea porphyrae TaxID=880732 RepID=UPI0022AFBD06|nr:phage tail protein [Maritalea porphyrae]MCZ4273292.1 phage tail protein [Maritalea porphyrae]